MICERCGEVLGLFRERVSQLAGHEEWEVVRCTGCEHHKYKRFLRNTGLCKLRPRFSPGHERGDPICSLAELHPIPQRFSTSTDAPGCFRIIHRWPALSGQSSCFLLTKETLSFDDLGTLSSHERNRTIGPDDVKKIRNVKCESGDWALTVVGQVREYTLLDDDDGLHCDWLGKVLSLWADKPCLVRGGLYRCGITVPQ